MNKYKRIRVSKTETRDEHRIVMEKHIGRRLSRKEVVHHKDENKSNNDINNLEIMLLSDHSRLHAPDRPAPMSENALIKARARTMGSQSPSAILTDDLVRWIRGAECADKSSRTISQELTVSKSAIDRVRSGKTWGHVDNFNLPLDITPAEGSNLIKI